MRRLIPALCLCLGLRGCPAAAAPPELTFPYPVLGAQALPAERGSYALPTAPFAAGSLPAVLVEGMVDRRAYRLQAPGASLLDVLAPLRAQLAAAGYELLLDCEARLCGGYDFRFATEIMAEPAMHVDLGDFRFLSARRGDEAISLLVSRAGDFAFVQVIRVGAEALAPPAPQPDAGGDEADLPGPAVTAPDPPVAPIAPVAGPADPAPVDAIARLDAGLPVVLGDLVFGSGSAALKDGEYGSLQALADWLAADAARTLALVGHSDASGGLKANVALSQRRAEAVRQVLMLRYGVNPGQVSAEGVGPLAPRASNLTEEGRRENRRVEAVPAPTL